MAYHSSAASQDDVEDESASMAYHSSAASHDDFEEPLAGKKAIAHRSTKPFDHDKWNHENILRVPICPKKNKRWDSIERKLVPTFGLCPKDEPVDYYLTRPLDEDEDRREIPPLTLRYTATSEMARNLVVSRHDDIINAYWVRMKEIMPDQPASITRPSIVFHHGNELLPLFDVTFANVDALYHARGFMELVHVEIEGLPDTNRLCFKNTVWSNTLTPDVMPIDILQLPQQVNPSAPAFIIALGDMVSGIGSVLGGATMQIGSWNDDGETTSGDTLRFYVQLTRESMKLDFQQLVDLIPTHMRWEGFAYPLAYSGRGLHFPDKFSKDYPLVQTSSHAVAARFNKAGSSSLATGGSSASADAVKEEETSGGEKRKRRKVRKA